MCYDCNGRGTKTTMQGPFMMQTTCRTCEGTWVENKNLLLEIWVLLLNFFWFELIYFKRKNYTWKMRNLLWGWKSRKSWRNSNRRSRGYFSKRPCKSNVPRTWNYGILWSQRGSKTAPWRLKYSFRLRSVYFTGCFGWKVNLLL